MLYNKDEIKEKLTLSNIYELLELFGGNPEYTTFGILSSTICHNDNGQGSRKLYYYANSKLFQCFTNCGSFDIFELIIKVALIQKHVSINLYNAVSWVAQRFKLFSYIEDENLFENFSTLNNDWKILNEYAQLKEISYSKRHYELPEFDKSILLNLNYNIKLLSWLKEGIKQEVIEQAQIGYYPGADQITIPHFDINNRFVGLRGRAMSEQDSELYGKYHPLRINKVLYNHPLGLNLYNLNNSKDNIKILKKAIIYESEKSCLKHQSFFGKENDISVACCGSSISNYQMQLLMDLQVNEIIIAFDRQFQKIGDDEYKRLVAKLTKLQQQYKNYAIISIIFDKHMITNYKDSPIDESPEKFLKLYKERIIL